ncbi:MAG: YlxR family protein [Clostridia bacterium]|nr:YlxR family protein [Clostridia bacterium]
MAKTKSIPMRTCIACREVKPKKEMLRVVRTSAGEILADPTGKLAGRGAYICGSEECMKKLNGKKLLNKAFSTEVSAEVYAGVEEEFSGNE